MDAQNLYITSSPEQHDLIHAAFGFKAMEWPGIRGAEREIQSMFNFLLTKPR